MVAASDVKSTATVPYFQAQNLVGWQLCCVSPTVNRPNVGVAVGVEVGVSVAVGGTGVAVGGTGVAVCPKAATPHTKV